MKNIKVAICGILAIAIHASTASAQMAQMTDNVLKALEKSQAFRSYEGKMAQDLGVKIGTAAEFNAALGKLSAAERSAVLGSVNSYLSKASSNPAAASSNEIEARKAFTVNGAVKQVTASAANSATRDAVTDKVTCDINLPQILATKSGYSVTRINELMAKGILVGVGTCGKETADMSPEALKHLVATDDYADVHGITVAAADQQEQIYAAGLGEAFAADGVKMPAGVLMEHAKGLMNEPCRYLPTTFNGR